MSMKPPSSSSLPSWSPRRTKISIRGPERLDARRHPTFSQLRSALQERRVRSDVAPRGGTFSKSIPLGIFVGA